MMDKNVPVTNRIKPIALDKMIPRFSAADFEKIVPQ